MNTYDSEYEGRNDLLFGRRRYHIGIKTMPTPLLVLLSLTVVSCTIPLPLFLLSSPLTVLFSWVAYILCSISIVLFSKKFSTIALPLILGFFLISYTGSPTLSALLFGSVISIGAGGAIIFSGKGFKTAIAVLLPLFSFSITFTLTGNLWASFLSLVYYPPLFALGISGRMRVGKTPSIVISAAFIIVMLIGAAAFGIHHTYGSISKETISLTGQFLSDFYVRMSENAFAAAGIGTMNPALRRQLQAEADLLVSSAFGIVTAICLIAVYLAHNLQCRILEGAGLKKLLSADMTVLTASAVSALIYIIAHVLTYTTGASGGTTVIAAVGANLCYILLPLYVLKGYEAFKFLLEKFYFWGMIAAIGIAIAVFMFSSASSSSVFVLIALVGAFYVIISEIEKWAKDHYGKAEQRENHF